MYPNFGSSPEGFLSMSNELHMLNSKLVVSAMSRLRSHSEYPANLFKPIPSNGNSAVPRRVEPKVVVSGVPRCKRPYPIQIDHVFPMAAHERRARKLPGKRIQPLNGMVGFFLLVRISVSPPGLRDKKSRSPRSDQSTHPRLSPAVCA